jgi:glycerophosphoryl diester phosphodiesterase
VTFVVAHRAGNDLTRLAEAEQLGVALVEADVRLWRGRLEVRHLKTIGPLPILWDRWRLANPLSPRLELQDLLAGAHRETHLLLDLKGRNPRLAELVLKALPRGRQVTICARSRRLLQPFVGREDLRLFQSVGSRRQLRSFLRRVDALVLDGVSVHERLLDEGVVEELRRQSAILMSWPVNTLQRAHELALLGVQGMISDHPSALLGGSG